MNSSCTTLQITIVVIAMTSEASAMNYLSLDKGIDAEPMEVHLR